MSIVSLIEVSTTSETISEGVDITIPNAMGFSNIGDVNPKFGAHLFKDIYIERQCKLSPIMLAQMPSGSRVIGGGDFVLRVSDVFIDEQFPPYFRNNPDKLSQLEATAYPEEEVTERCILIARYGLYTWGHWLGELLPKAVMIEKRFPRRYKFVIPSQVYLDLSATAPWTRIRESLAAYGITRDRVILIDADRDYVFTNLSTVTSVWSDYLIHPDASSDLRDIIQTTIATVSKKKYIGILRDGRYGRSISNLADITALLRDGGFELFSLGGMSFLDQVWLFQQAELIFGVLGSDLTGILYCRPGIKVITAAPGIFGDRFFYALILDRSGIQIDLRGPLKERDPVILHKSQFSLDPEVLDLALRRI